MGFPWTPNFAAVSVSSSIGVFTEFDGGGDFNNSPWLCTDVTGSADTVAANTSSNVWYAGALEFGAVASAGYASAGYASLNGGTNFLSGTGSIASATVENITAGAAYVVYAIATAGGNYITSAPGSPWTPYTALVEILGLGSAWLIGENDNPIPVSFETSGTSWAMWLVELLRTAAVVDVPVTLAVSLSQASIAMSLTQ